MQILIHASPCHAFLSTTKRPNTTPFPRQEAAEPKPTKRRSQINISFIKKLMGEAWSVERSYLQWNPMTKLNLGLETFPGVRLPPPKSQQSRGRTYGIHRSFPYQNWDGAIGTASGRVTVSPDELSWKAECRGLTFKTTLKPLHRTRRAGKCQGGFGKVANQHLARSETTESKNAEKSWCTRRGRYRNISRRRRKSVEKQGTTEQSLLEIQANVLIPYRTLFSIYLFAVSIKFSSVGISWSWKLLSLL